MKSDSKNLTYSIKILGFCRQKLFQNIKRNENTQIVIYDIFLRNSERNKEDVWDIYCTLCLWRFVLSV